MQGKIKVSKTISENTSAQIVEKKSKFIANIYYVQTQEEIENILKEIRKKYYDAKHNCYAYSILTKDGLVNKMSDDGEPSGSAGAPMLNIITKNELTNILVVVTRYFGGILLGTGGLVKAYSEATISALKKAKIVNEEIGYEIEVTISYNEWEKFKYYCEKNNINIINVIYDEKIKSRIEITNIEKTKINELIKENTLKIENLDIIKEKNIRKNIEI